MQNLRKTRSQQEYNRVDNWSSVIKPVEHSGIKPKQNNETAQSSFRFVSALLAYFSTRE